MGRLGSIVTGLALCGVLASATSAQTCVGDCSRTGTVTIGDLIVAVNVALGIRPGTSCPAHHSGAQDGRRDERAQRPDTKPAQSIATADPSRVAFHRDDPLTRDSSPHAIGSLDRSA